MIDVQGTDLPLNMPISSFEPSELPQLSAQLLENLRRMGETPTPLQRHVVPVALAGRDTLVVGESDAASLLLPVVSLLAIDPRALPRSSGGLRALVLAPTREAAAQTVREARQLARRTPLRSTLACGGVSLEETLAELTAGVELLVATPGRLVDLVERGRVQLGGVRLLALLGLDALLDFGFEPQIRRLLQQEGLPHERQTLLSCARLGAAERKWLAELARADLVTVGVGAPRSLRAACRSELVTQRVVFAEERAKQLALGEQVRASAGRTVVVCSTRRRCEMVSLLLQGEGIEHLAQPERLKAREREAAVQSFLRGKCRVLLLSDAALKELAGVAGGGAGGAGGAGAHVAHLVGFDLPATMELYAERVAHVGRGGHTGTVTTIVGECEAREALQQLAALLRETDNDVPRWLEGQATLAHSAPPEA